MFVLNGTLTNVSDDASRLQVQQELPDLGPGFVAAVVEIWSDLVVDAMHMLSLELTGGLLHGDRASCSGLTVACLQGQTHLSAQRELIDASNSSSFSSGKQDKEQSRPPDRSGTAPFLSTCLLRPKEFSWKSSKKQRRKRLQTVRSVFEASSLPGSPLKGLKLNRDSFTHDLNIASISSGYCLE